MPVIHSRLAKAAALTESATFPQMVQAAAGETSVPYTHGLLTRVAADPEVTAAVDLPVHEGMDAALEQMTTDPAKAAELDDLIVAAVQRHSEEEL